MEGGVAFEGGRLAADVIPSAPEAEVRAAGGVVWRVDRDGGVEVLLVHRQRYHDWSFPKGKVEPDDVDEEHTALREVEEEVGLRCALGRELPSVDYLDHKRRTKHVRYWEMRPLSGTFTPNDEVDDIIWLGLAGARQKLSYEHDKGVLAAFAAWS